MIYGIGSTREAIAEIWALDTAENRSHQMAETVSRRIEGFLAEVFPMAQAELKHRVYSVLNGTLRVMFADEAQAAEIAEIVCENIADIQICTQLELEQELYRPLQEELHTVFYEEEYMKVLEKIIY